MHHGQARVFVVHQMDTMGTDLKSVPMFLDFKSVPSLQTEQVI
jgi:hypothetical protein